jgi:hypothetical protein
LTDLEKNYNITALKLIDKINQKYLPLL